MTTSPSRPNTSVMRLTRRLPSIRRDEVDDQVERRGDLLADRAQRQLDAAHEHEHLEAVEGVARRVRVDRGQRALVAGVHGLEHVERLGAADLAHDDAVGAHAQRVADELADADLALALDVRRARLERDDVALLELELGRVLDRHDALVAGTKPESALSSVVLPEPVPPEIRMLTLPRTQAARNVAGGGRQRAERGQVGQRVRVARELPDRQRRAAQRERRDDRVDAAAVGQARVDHRRALVDAAADLRDDAVDDPQDVRRRR